VSSPSLQSGQDIIRGSSDIPLSGDGLQQAHDLGVKFAQKGGLDKLATSDLGRAQQTAKIISHYTHAPIVYNGDKLQPWHLGQHEGTPTSEALPEMERYMTTHPDEVPPGRGPESTQDGESFNSFKNRGLSAFKMLLAEHTADPSAKIGAVTHYRNIRLANAWVKEGGVGNDRINPDYMKGKAGPPGSVWRLAKGPGEEPSLKEISMDDPSPLGGGVYLIRHGLTAWNEENGK
jgi:broad specificity phosphatase PhoE